jgi:rhodanese-related sulfurtransferase
VRTPEEFAAGHLPGAVSAPGGQLVQAIDRWVGVRGARLVLVDDAGVRAVMTAHWLQQMGWDAVVLEQAIDGAAERGGDTPHTGLRNLPTVEPGEAVKLLAQGAAAIVLGASAAYRLGHPPGAVWTIRPRLDRLPDRVLGAPRILIFADDPSLARLAAIDLAELSHAGIALVNGGIAAWRQARLPVTASPELPPDSECIDFIFWNHDRHDGNREAMRAYLQWELDLPGEIARDGLSGFRGAAAAG